MSTQIPTPGSPRRRHGPRDPGDAFVTAPDGRRYWGRFGAAGLLAVDPDRGILLQHRVGWSHHGGTWALPGGALHRGESARAGALREAHEEAGVPADAVRATFLSVLDLGIWSYSTVVARVVRPFEPVISDAESLALAWVAPEDVGTFPLHPGFAASWPALRGLLELSPALVVDVWHDAAARPRAEEVAREGVEGADLGLPVTRAFPEVVAVDSPTPGAVAEAVAGLRARGCPVAVLAGGSVIGPATPGGAVPGVPGAGVGGGPRRQ